MYYNTGMYCNHRHKGFEFLKFSKYTEAKILFYFISFFLQKEIKFYLHTVERVAWRSPGVNGAEALHN